MLAAAVLPAVAESTTATPILQVAINDVGVGMRQAFGCFELARRVGASGVEVDFGRLGLQRDLQSRLITPAGRLQFIDAAERAGVSIASLNFSAFTGRSFTNHPQSIALAGQFIDALSHAGVRVGVLPIGRTDELADDAFRTRTIDRLKQAATLAELAGVTLAVDTDLPLAELKQLLDAVGSPAVAACLAAQPAEGIDRAFDLLGTSRVAQIRFRYDDSSSQRSPLAALRATCVDRNWAGWIVVDRPAASAGDVLGDAGLAVRRLTEAFTPVVV